MCDWSFLNRLNLADDPNTPIEVLIKLSKDNNYDVRDCVAKNPNTPIEILKELLNDDDKLCRLSALQTLIKKKNLKLFT